MSRFSRVTDITALMTDTFVHRYEPANGCRNIGDIYNSLQQYNARHSTAMLNKVLIFIMKIEHKMGTLHTSQVPLHLQMANNTLPYTSNLFYCLRLHHVTIPESHDTLTLLR